MISTYELNFGHPWVTNPSNRIGGSFQMGDGQIWTMRKHTVEELEELEELLGGTPRSRWRVDRRP